MSLYKFPDTPAGRLQEAFWHSIEEQGADAPLSIVALASLLTNLIGGFTEAETRKFWVHNIVTQLPHRVKDSHENLQAQIRAAEAFMEAPPEGSA